MRRLVSQAEQNAKPLADVRENFGRSGRSKFDATRVPIKVLDVVRENDTRDFAVLWKSYFKWVALHVAGDRARDGETRLRVVRAR